MKHIVFFLLSIFAVTSLSAQASKHRISADTIELGRPTGNPESIIKATSYKSPFDKNAYLYTNIIGVMGMDTTLIDSITLADGYTLKVYSNGSYVGKEINIIQKSGYTLGIGVDEGGQDVAVLSRTNADGSITLFKLDTTTANIGMISPGGNITALQTEVGRASLSSDDGSNTSTIIVLPTSTSINTDSFLLNVPGSGSSLGIGANNEVYRFSGSSGWGLSGDAAVTSSFLGSTDSSRVQFKYNNILRMTLNSNGILIGKNAPTNVARYLTIKPDTNVTSVDTTLAIYSRHALGQNLQVVQYTGTDGVERFKFLTPIVWFGGASAIQLAGVPGVYASTATIAGFNIFGATLSSELAGGGQAITNVTNVAHGVSSPTFTATRASIYSNGSITSMNADLSGIYSSDISAGGAAIHAKSEDGYTISLGSEIGTQSNNDAILVANGVEMFRLLAGKTAVKFVPTTEPTSPAEGWCYWDDATNKLRCYDGSVWNDLW